MFLDEATLEVKGGNGGRGCVSWRREKYEPMGGPDGGNGGRGGDVFLVADENTDTLSDFSMRKRFEAKIGRFGMGKNRAGREGEDIELRVPPGTIVELVSDGENEVLGELLTHGDRMLVASGGRGGFGNAHFKSAVRQRPDFAELGEPGEQKKIHLELKLIADAGIIGYPSVGKSTLISVISSARPKIGDYPFTTLIPNLGVVSVSDRSYVVCDVPGLIEGASEGKGLGDAFLKHIERCGVLLHMLDLSRAFAEGGAIDPEILAKDYRAIRHELEAFSPTLSNKRELIILNKIDLVDSDIADLERSMANLGVPIFKSISAAAHIGVEEMKKELLPIVLDERKKREEGDASSQREEGLSIPTLRPHLASHKMGAYRIEKKEDGSIHIAGKRIEQFVVMTDFANEGAARRFRDVIDRVGVRRALSSKWDGSSPIFIGSVRVDTFL